MYYKQGLLLLGGCLSILLSIAQVKGVHLSWNNKEENATAHTMAITWTSDSSGYNIVLYGVDSNALNLKARATPVWSTYLKTYVYKCDLRQLQSGTSYYYRVVNASSAGSKLFRFRTATDTSSEMMVGVWSDTQNNTGNKSFEQSNAIVQQLSQYPLHFTIHTGDIVENGSMVDSWKGFFHMAEPLNANYPLMSVTGNHDVVNDTTSHSFQQPFPVYYELFNLPNDQLNYSYTYGNAHFVAINSGFAKGAEGRDAILFKPGSPEYRWLEQDLAKARQNKTIQWIIVYCHYPMYAYGVSQVSGWQQHLTPLFDKYAVDLCIAGHRHVYERHKAVKGTTIFRMANKHLYKQPRGTIYITNGSSGGSLQGTGGKKLPTMVFTPAKNVYTYAIMKIGQTAIRFDVMDIQGRRIDHFKIVRNIQFDKAE